MIVATPVEQLELPDEALYEIVDGIKVEKPVSVFSIWVASELCQLVGPHCKATRRGWAVTEMVFVLDRTSDLRRRPDFAFVSAERWPLDKPLPYVGDWNLAPDLAVEVASPGNTFTDLAGKVTEYFQHGVNEVWIVVPEKRQVYVYRTPRDARILSATDVLSTPLIPGWSIPVGDFLPVPPRPEPMTGAG